MVVSETINQAQERGLAAEAQRTLRKRRESVFGTKGHVQVREIKGLAVGVQWMSGFERPSRANFSEGGTRRNSRSVRQTSTGRIASNLLNVNQ